MPEADRARIRAACAIALSGLLSTAWTAPAGAAVLECRVAIHAVGEDPTSEAQARRRAMSRWLSQAAKFGQGYTRWQLAGNRRVFCAKTAAGHHTCAVTGEPCTVKQAPGMPTPKTGPRGKTLDI